MPGIRDQHSGCVGAYLIENDLFDFLLLSLPDNDAFSHRNGPHAQVSSIAAADRQLERLMHAAGGPEEFFSEHAVIVASDHSQAAVEERIRLDRAFADFEVALPAVARSVAPEVALSPAQRAAMIYALDEDRRDGLMRRAIAVARTIPGVDLVLWLDGEEAVVRSARGELRFVAGGELEDQRGNRWSVEGDLVALGAEVKDGRLLSPSYPNALERAWAALRCPNAGDVLLSAAPGYEFVDWGGAAHVGGGSHGSLHRSDSLGALLWCGTGPSSNAAPREWSLRDVAPMVRAHFGVTADLGPFRQGLGTG
jgi:hypothetical protein